MNFGFNPLSSYLSSVNSGDPPLEKASFVPQNSIQNEMSDWGIEESAISSRHTSVSQKPYSESPTLYHESQRTLKDCNFFTSTNEEVITTQILSNFIRKYLSTHNIMTEFWEKFKYELMISNLLDDSMILSKNEQCLKELALRTSDKLVDHREKRFIKSLNNDGVNLFVSKNYTVNYPGKYFKTGNLLYCINTAIATLKSIINGTIHPISVQNRFKTLLIVCTKILYMKRMTQFVESSKVKSKLEDFLRLNYQLNKHFMSNVLRVKECEMFNKGKYDSTKIDHALTIVTQHFQNSIKTLLPYMNGPILEQYCTINNINWNVINDQVTENNTIMQLTKKLSKFNQLRKLFTCQLLIMDEIYQRNFFLCKLFDDFNISDDSSHSPKNKLHVLTELFEKSTTIFKALNFYFESLETKVDEEIENQDILHQSFSQMLPNDSENINTGVNDSNLSVLINRLSTLTTNLQYFQKYNASTSKITDIDELNEKLHIFSKFGEEINSIKEFLQISVNDFGTSIQTARSPTSSTSSTRRNSGTFNLKSFHTTQTSISKKRLSLPANIQELGNNKASLSESPVLPSPTSTSFKNPTNRSDKKYKRLSTGLQIGLLTVLEEPHSQNQHKRSDSNISNSTINNTPHQSSSHPRSVSYDDNYINILPPNSYINESYNQAALESLSTNNNDHIRKILGKDFSNRYSLNSMNSNVSGISDLIASTEATTIDRIEDNSIDEGENNSIDTLSKENLKLKLEENFSRMYSMETTVLKDEAINKPSSPKLASNKLPDNDFLNSLDNTLQRNLNP